MEGYTKLVLVMLVAAVMVGHEVAVAAGQNVCGMNLAGLMACKPSVCTDADPVPPSKACCRALKGADMQCLCDLKQKKDMLASYSISPDLAVQLPGKCGMPAGSVPCIK
ncbi:hypothetical protein NMG60_11019614 [Bertholletia excelsa]